MKNVIDHLKKRNFIEALTSDQIAEALEKPQKIYVGFDMTARSLHLGNLACLILLKWFQLSGHTPVILLGGATTKIGDPSGKSQERPLLPVQEIEKNFQAIKEQVGRFLDFEGDNGALIYDNDTWLGQINFVDFLRDVGKHFRLGPMLGKESVRERLKSEEGMSFTEFSYPLLQGYDFFHLARSEGVFFQAGGSDQWGNILAGIELSRRLNGPTLYGLTFPLITRSDGKKFGKSEKGALWLDKAMTSPYELYQYLYSVPDSDVIKLMQRLTFIDCEVIEEFEREREGQKLSPNFLQKRLAEEVVLFVHGEKGLSEAMAATQGAAFGSGELTAKSLSKAAEHLPNISLTRDEVVGKTFSELAHQVGLLKSKGEANRLIKGGGAYINNEKVSETTKLIGPDDLIDQCFLLLGSGKKKKMLIAISDSTPS